MGRRIHAAPAGHVCAHRSRIEVWQSPRNVCDAERPIGVRQRARSLEDLYVDGIHLSIIHVYILMAAALRIECVLSSER